MSRPPFPEMRGGKERIHHSLVPLLGPVCSMGAYFLRRGRQPNHVEISAAINAAREAGGEGLSPDSLSLADMKRSIGFASS